MILSSIFLNPVHREVQRCLADSHAMHTRVMSLFGITKESPARAAFAVLYRSEVSEREGTVRVLLQSREAPDFARWPEGVLDPRAEPPNPRTTNLAMLLDGLVPESRYRFRLHANPTRKIDTKTRADGTKSNGQRVPIRADEERMAWLHRRGDQHGFRLAQGEHGETLARVLPAGRTTGRRQGAQVTHEGALYEGLLDVSDPVLLRAAIERGIGTGKSYGFGLLSLAPAAR